MEIKIENSVLVSQIRDDKKELILINKNTFIAMDIAVKLIFNVVNKEVLNLMLN